MAGDNIINKDFILQREEFKKRFLNEVRNGLSKSFIDFLLDYNNSTERYIAELEYENLRLFNENSVLRQKISKINITAIESVSWLQSMLIKQLNRLKNDFRARNIKTKAKG